MEPHQNQEDIADIRKVVHRINENVLRMEREQLNQDKRISILESRQSGFETVMRDEHKRIHDRIDGLENGMREIKEVLVDHTKQEDKDRKQLLDKIGSTMVSVFINLGAWALMMIVWLVSKIGNNTP